MKICTKCHVEPQAYPDRNNNNYCKPCNAANGREYYQKNRKRKKLSTDWSTAGKTHKTSYNPSYNWFKTAKNRAKKNGREFTITFEHVLALMPENNICPVFGFVMEHGGDRNTSPSIDRIDSSKGCVEGNIQIISKLANSMKQNADSKQLLQFCDWVQRTNQ